MNPSPWYKGRFTPKKIAIAKKWALDKRRTQPRGKQSSLHSYQCVYTRTTGIWQTVWLEAADKNI